MKSIHQMQPNKRKKKIQLNLTEKLNANAVCISEEVLSISHAKCLRKPSQHLQDY